MRRADDPSLAAFRTGLVAGCTRAHAGEGHEVWRRHGMDGWIVHLTVAGRGRCNRGAERFAIVPGDLLLWPPDVVHDYGPDPPLAAWTHWWCYFTAKQAWLELLDWPVGPGGVRRLRAPEALRPRLVAIFEDIVALARGPLARRQAFACARLEELLLWCDTLVPPRGGRAPDERVQRACAFLCERHRERITLARLARACGLSSSRLSHLFRAELGQTAMEYLEAHRMARARDLLAMSAQPIAGVAAAVGFDDPLYFSRVFRRHAGESPRAWRKRAR